MADYEVISAFLDNEPFDPQELSEALATPDGRALLIDLLTLRRLMQPEETVAPVSSGTRRAPRVLRLFLAAATLVLAVVGGYELGERSGTPSVEAPPPARVIPAEGEWRDLSEGARQ
jgi:hypothetical protein